MCQQVKAEHQRPAGLLQPLEIAEWKWEYITMDFVTHFPWTSQKHDAVWVIVDRLTKSAHFLAVWMTFTLEEFYRLYIREIVRLHGVPVSIITKVCCIKQKFVTLGKRVLHETKICYINIVSILYHYYKYVIKLNA